MKISKKKILVVALAVCLVAIISMGTLAWFQASDEVTNIFKVSTDSNQQPDFKIDIFEHEADEDGQISNVEVDSNTYENVAPGDQLFKDPTVRNAGQYDQWVRINVTLEDYAAWEAILGTGFDFSTLLKGVSTDWSLDHSTIGTDTLVYYKDAKLAVGAESTLFEGVSIPGEEFTVANMPTQFNLKIVADAIQADNTGNSAQYAFTNFWN